MYIWSLWWSVEQIIGTLKYYYDKPSIYTIVVEGMQKSNLSRCTHVMQISQVKFEYYRSTTGLVGLDSHLFPCVTFFLLRIWNSFQDYFTLEISIAISVRIPRENMKLNTIKCIPLPFKTNCKSVMAAVHVTLHILLGCKVTPSFQPEFILPPRIPRGRELLRNKTTVDTKRLCNLQLRTRYLPPLRIALFCMAP